MSMRKKNRAAAAVSRSAESLSWRSFLKTAGAGATSLAALGGVSAAAQAADPIPTEDVDLFATMYSMWAMRRLKPDPIPDEILRKIRDWDGHNNLPLFFRG